MRFQINTEPPMGATRVIKKFFLFPTQIEDELGHAVVLWLETATVEQEYGMNSCDSAGWVTKRIFCK